jgi:integrase
MKLTDRIIARIEVPSEGYRIVWDSEVRGLGLRVTQAGVRSFLLNYRFQRRERRYTIGQVPVWNIARARAEAIKLRQAIESGIDPIAVRQAERDTPTVAQALERFAEEHYPTLRASTQALYCGLIRTHIQPEFGKRLVTAVTEKDVRTFYNRLNARYPAGARQILNLLSALFAYAVKWGDCPVNPVAGIKRERLPDRERYLNSEELARALAALDARPCSAADIIKLLVLTGARKGEAAMATWDQFDLTAAVWTKPAHTTKQKRLHRVPLSDEAAALLRRMRASNPANALFVSKRTGEPYTRSGAYLTLQFYWNEVRRAAGIPDVRIHDLRHSYASSLINNGLSLAVVGGLLGHTSPHITSRYAHLADDTLRQATAIVGRAVGRGRTAE